jgi:Protein of unknown function (DUF3995)
MRALLGTVRVATAATLATIGGMHVAWGRGSAFPFADRADLTDAVVGRDAAPSPAACYGVAGLLAGAAALVLGAPGVPRRLRRPGVATVALVLAGRGVLGLTGHTDLLSPRSSTPRFRRLDRLYFAPLCLALALGSTTGLVRRRR